MNRLIALPSLHRRRWSCHVRMRSRQDLTKIPFPYGPLGLNSMPFMIAKEARLFEKHGLAVDMVYVGASAVMVQSMLSGLGELGGLRWTGGHHQCLERR